MHLSVDFDLDVRCVSCGTERDFPERAERVLEAKALFVEAADPCACGSRRVRVEVKLEDAPEAVPEGRPEAPRRE